MKIVLISCVKTKLPHKAKAKNLYTSPLFKYSLKYAKSFNPDKTFILSAKHGLLNLEQEVESYEQTLNQMNSQELKLWVKKILEKLKTVCDLEKDEIILLTGNNYGKHLLPHISNYKLPLKGLSMGKRLQFLKEKTSNENLCEEVHCLFDNAKKLDFPFDKKEIPLNGIYILFEKGEKGHDSDRIVRVGTHTGKDQLRSRIHQHFVNENKDRSIFRKNIGRALLNKEKDPYLKIWDLDLTTRESKEKFGKLIDEKKQKEIEKKVTKYLQNNFTFILIPIDNKDERLNTESKIISTVSLCKNCNSSQNWLGLHSPKQKIKDSGLWLVNELYKNPLSKEDFKKLKRILEI